MLSPLRAGFVFPALSHRRVGVLPDCMIGANGSGMRVSTNPNG
jgi:hypothetical protein